MKPARPKKVLLAMSGGVDSSVAAGILLEEGFEVVGCFMRLGSENSVETIAPGNPEAANTSHRQGCCSVNDAADARLVAARLQIPFYVLNFKRDFARIIDHFADEYHAGRTPNPCVRCNNWLKFGKLLDYADCIEADFVATGHYARLQHHGNGVRLLRGVDHRKDQSYVLFGLEHRVLERVLLPIGGLTKAETRRLARRSELSVHDKPDSQEICFVPDNDYAGLLRRHSGSKVRPGTILDTEGQVVGQHDGHQHFTIGQRRGLGVAFGYPVYVVERNPEANTITVGRKENLAASGCRADQTNWLIEPPQKPIRCSAKVRYNTAPVPAIVGADGADELTVHFDEPVLAVTPGQAVVCYDGDRVLGGGWIRECLHGACSPT